MVWCVHLSCYFRASALKKWLSTRTWQFCTQVVIAHMVAYSDMGGWGFLKASLSPAAADPLGVTHINMDGHHLIRNSGCSRLVGRQWWDPLFWFTPLVLLGWWVWNCGGWCHPVPIRRVWITRSGQFWGPGCLQDIVETLGLWPSHCKFNLL